MGKHLVNDPQRLSDDPCSILSSCSPALLDAVPVHPSIPARLHCCVRHIFIGGPAERWDVTTSLETTLSDCNHSARRRCLLVLLPFSKHTTDRRAAVWQCSSCYIGCSDKRPGPVCSAPCLLRPLLSVPNVATNPPTKCQIIYPIVAYKLQCTLPTMMQYCS